MSSTEPQDRSAPGINGYDYGEPVTLACPPERHMFHYAQYGQPERRVEMVIDGPDLAVAYVIGEFAAHLVACGYSAELVGVYIPWWNNIRSPN